MKEKYDLSLDNRQVVSLLIGAVVVLGAVFVLGVVVGKKLSTSQEAAQAPDLLSALDAQAEAHARAREEAPDLTFPDELTRKTTGNVPASEPVQRPPVVTIEVPAARPATPPAEAAQEVVAAAGKPAQEEPARVPAPAANAAPAKRAEEKPAVAEAPRKSPNELVATRTVALGASRTPTTSRPAAPTGTAPNGTFSLQLSASQSREEADRFAQKLRERGYAPFVVEAEVEGKGTWYRVRMGRFPNKEAASRYLADFRRETRMEAFITNAN